MRERERQRKTERQRDTDREREKILIPDYYLGYTAFDISRRNKRTACVQVLEARLKSPGKILLVYLYLLCMNIDI